MPFSASCCYSRTTSGSMVRLTPRICYFALLRNILCLLQTKDVKAVRGRFAYIVGQDWKWRVRVLACATHSGNWCLEKATWRSKSCWSVGNWTFPTLGIYTRNYHCKCLCVFAAQIFILFTTAAKHLRVLQIERCENISEDAIFRAKHSLQSLESVNISYNLQSGVLAIACLCSYESVTDICFDGIKLESKEILFLAKTFPRLRSGDIEIHSDGIGGDYFWDAVNILDELVSDWSNIVLLSGLMKLHFYSEFHHICSNYPCRDPDQEDHNILHVDILAVNNLRTCHFLMKAR